MPEAPVRANTPNAGGTAGAQLIAQNEAARRAIRQRAQNMIQLVSSVTQATPGTQNNIFNWQPRLVGFLKRFYVEVIATVANGGSTNTLTLTPLGPSQILSRMMWTDLSNNVRHNSPGWHFHFTASAKRMRPFGSAGVTDSPVGFGSNFNVINAPASIAPGASGTVYMVYEVPITYDDTNFSGGMWMGVTQATAFLQTIVNPNPGANSGGDPTLAVYESATGAADCSITSVTINVYQNYLDQLPTDQTGRVILPINDISTVYMLQDTTQQNITQNQDYPIPYANARDFLSTWAIFDNGGSLNAGSDINTWAIRAANFINFLQYDPMLSALLTRNSLTDDAPAGCYYWSHRWKPISTAQFGNTELVLNAKTVSSTAKLFIGYEMFALVNLVAQAGALAIA
jgi:hypothetical protein